MPDDAPWVDPVVVPDDLRELQADIDAYHRELRHAARRRRIERVTGTGWWRRFALPGAVVSGALALAAIVFVILTLGQPRLSPAPLVRPVASAPGAGVGEVDGLLPDVQLVSHTAGAEATETIGARSLRPAAVALVPVRCACTDLLLALASEAETARLPLVVVAPTAADAEVDALAGRAHYGRIRPLFDPTGSLAGTYAARGVTVLLVAADATVPYVVHDLDANAVRQLGLPLQQMAASAAGSAH